MGEAKLSLTDRDMQTIASALCNAQEERDSLAYAYGRRGAEAKRAADWVKRYERLYVKLFGKPSPRTEDAARFAAAPAVSIHELMVVKRDGAIKDSNNG